MPLVFDLGCAWLEGEGGGTYMLFECCLVWLVGVLFSYRFVEGTEEGGKREIKRTRKTRTGNLGETKGFSPLMLMDSSG